MRIALAMASCWIAALLLAVQSGSGPIHFSYRPIAFVLAGEMAVAYHQVHFPKSFFPSVNMGVPAIMYCFFFLYLVFAGPGEWSLDAMIARGRRHEHSTQ